MTANLPAQTDEDHPVMAPVTFILAGPRLVTVRFHEPRAFVTFPLRASRVNLGCGTGEAVLVALLEAIINRLADVLERTGDRKSVVQGKSVSVRGDLGGRAIIQKQK